MGASVSTNATTVENEIVSKALQTCPVVSGSNVTSISNTTFSPWPGCDKSSFNVKQSTSISSECALSSLQKAAAESAQQLSAEAQATLGFSVSTNVADTENSLKVLTEQTCKDVSTTNIVDVDNVTFHTCDVYITQDATANTSCQIDATQDQISDIAVEMAAESSGWGWWEILALIGGIILLIILLIGGVFLIRMLMGMGSKKQQSTIIVAPPPPPIPSRSSKPTTAPPPVPSRTTKPTTAPPPVPDRSTKPDTESTASDDIDSVLIGGGDEDYRTSAPYIVLIGLALAAVVAYMFSKQSPSKKVITNNDLENFSNTVNEAQKIAGFNHREPLSHKIFKRYTDPNLDSSMMDQSYQLYQSNYSNQGQFSEDNIRHRCGPNNDEQMLSSYYQPLLG